jgi:tetratricopeptide (TPR) repeat protein
MLLDLYNKQQNWVKLEEVARKYLAILPNNQLANNYLKASLNKTPYFENSTGSNSKDETVAAYVNQSLTFYNEGKYTECIEVCNKALAIDPKKIEAYINIGAANNQQKNWTKAIKALNKALEIDPNNKLALGNLNWAQTELKKAKN